MAHVSRLKAHGSWLARTRTCRRSPMPHFGADPSWPWACALSNEPWTIKHAFSNKLLGYCIRLSGYQLGSTTINNRFINQLINCSIINVSVRRGSAWTWTSANLVLKLRHFGRYVIRGFRSDTCCAQGPQLCAAAAYRALMWVSADNGRERT